MIHARERREDDAVRFPVPSRSSSPALTVTSSPLLFGSFAFVNHVFFHSPLRLACAVMAPRSA